MKNIIYPLKLFIGATLAILLASCLQLQFSISAGIVAILSTATTKKETIRTALNRFIAFLFALLISFLCFNLFGFTTLGFLIYLFLFIFFCVKNDMVIAIAMDSVLISHFLTFQNMSLPSLQNEILLFIIGVGMGICMNLDLHKNSSYIEQMKMETDEKMKEILFRMGERIGNPNLENYDGHCFKTIQTSIDTALSIAQKNYDNQFLGDKEDLEYIHMRLAQKEILYEMYKRVNELQSVPVSAQAIQSFFTKVSQEYARENTLEDLYKDYLQIATYMKELPLPSSREEFEDRARLFQVLQNMDEFLQIKMDYLSRKK